MSAASAARRVAPDLDVVVCEAGGFAAYGMCGIPYFLGGTVPRAESLLAYPTGEFRGRRGIDLRLHTRVDDLDAGGRQVRISGGGSAGPLGYDALVIATGAEFSRTGFSGVIPEPIAGWEQPHVLTPEQVLRGEKQPGQKVLIVDEEYNQVAPGLAELLARQGKKVTLVTSQPSIGGELLFTMALPHVLARLAESGVEIIPTHYVKTIDGSSVQLFNVCAPQVETRLTGIDTVILVATRETRDSLSAKGKAKGKVKGKVKELHAIGDCVAPRDIGAAIFEGHRVARSL